MLKTLFFLNVDLPTRLFKKYADLPVLGNAKMRKDAQRLTKVNQRAWDLGSKMFAHFVSNEWIFETKEMFRMIDAMSLNDRSTYQINVKCIDWPSAINLYMYGM